MKRKITTYGKAFLAIKLLEFMAFLILGFTYSLWSTYSNRLGGGDLSGIIDEKSALAIIIAALIYFTLFLYLPISVIAMIGMTVGSMKPRLVVSLVSGAVMLLNSFVATIYVSGKKLPESLFMFGDFRFAVCWLAMGFVTAGLTFAFWPRYDSYDR